MAQEKGFVNENLEAVLTIELSNGSTMECVLDTGFNGFLLLPRSFVEANSLDFVGREAVTMVEQKTTEIDFAAGTVKWLGEEILVGILVSEVNESLLGTQMLIDSVLKIDYKNLTVKITK